MTDGSFEGLLSAIFEAYTTAQSPDVIEPAGNYQPGLFDRTIPIATDVNQADRVWHGLKIHLDLKRRRRLFEAFLAGEPGVATAIYRFIQDTLPGRRHRKENGHISAHIDIGKLSRKVRQEAHRMKGFVRFEQTADDRYLALVAPRYDVLPLVRRHFEKRFADQAWIIYDTQRNYGLCYDRHRTHELTLDANELHTIRSDSTASERLSQTLWQRYFAAVNIPQRANPRLHLSKLPRRYWHYLTEKKKG